MYKRTIKSLLLSACTLTILSITPAQSADQISSFVPNAQKVGEGRLTYLVWDVYDATLYAPQGTWENGQPFALELSYLRGLQGKKIADRSAEEMRNQGVTDEIKLAAWHEQMRKIFPDVAEGVRITGVYTQESATVFYRDNIKIGKITDPEFSKAFFGIWLNETTSAPDLRKQLLGEA